MGISTLFSLASITITVNDQNDIGPLFQMRSYAMSIAENFDTGKPYYWHNLVNTNTNGPVKFVHLTEFVFTKQYQFKHIVGTIFCIFICSY